MKSGIFDAHPLPRPWDEGDEVSPKTTVKHQDLETPGMDF
jgi:hypothetical protein